VLLFTLAVSSLAGVLIGIVPAWRSAHVQLTDAMKVRPGGTTSGRGVGRLRGLLVGAEVALSAVCLITSGLLLHSSMNLLTVDTGFDGERMVTVDLNLSGPRYRTLEARAAFRRAVSEQLHAIPGVSSVGISNKLPLTGTGQNSAITLESPTVPLLERPVADVRPVDPEYFRTWGIPLKAGRLFDVADGNRPVALVSEYTAVRVWPGQNPIGKRFRFGGNPVAPLVEVVGVVGDVRNISLERAPDFAAYMPYWQRDSQFASIAIRTGIDPSTIAPGVRAAIRHIDPDLPAPAVRTMNDVVNESTAERRFQMNLILLFAMVAMLLAGLGIYGVLSYTVTQRTNEIGIRLALGARPGGVRRLVLYDAMRLVLGGLAAGVPLAIAIGYSLRALLFGVVPQDPVTVFAVCATITSVALMAAYLPAHRASRVDPMAALRCE
jgi:putative ABC transport system permease protein